MNAARTGRQGQDASPKDPSFRPRFTRNLADNIKKAAGLAGMTVPTYLERVVGPFVQTDLRTRVVALADMGEI